MFIGDAPPNFKHSYRVIDSVTILNAPDWFSFTPIPLNNSLVTIIGGKGAGKSALAEINSVRGWFRLLQEPKGKRAQGAGGHFCQQGVEKRPPGIPPKPITGAKIRLTWADTQFDEVELSDSLFHGLQEEKVKYLPQKFVEQVCSPQNDAELLLEVERVVFQRIPKSDRLGCVTFSDLRSFSTKGISVKKTHLANEIEELNRDIFVDFQNCESKIAKAAQLAKLHKEATTLAKQKPDVSSLNAPDLQKLDGLQMEMRQLESQLTGLKQQLSTLDELEAVLTSVRQKVLGFNVEINSLLNRLGLAEEAATFSIAVPETLDDSLLAKRISLNQKSICSQSGLVKAIPLRHLAKP